MEARNAVCVLAALHVLNRFLRPHQRRIVDKMKLIPYTLALRSASAVSSNLLRPLAALAVRHQVLAA